MIGEKKVNGNLVGSMNMNKRLKKDELIKLIEELNLERCDFTLLSSSALVFRGIMDDAGDLDIAVTKDGFDKLSKKFDLKDKGNGFYIVNDNCECIVDDMEGKKELVDNYYLQDINYYWINLILLNLIIRGASNPGRGCHRKLSNLYHSNGTDP